MPADWAAACARGDLTQVGPDALEVPLGARRHRVTLRTEGDLLLVRAHVARAAAVREVPDLALRLVRRNRTSPVVGFGLDAAGDLVGEARVATAGLDAEELRLLVRRTAVECDRLELELTGQDVE